MTSMKWVTIHREATFAPMRVPLASQTFPLISIHDPQPSAGRHTLEHDLLATDPKIQRRQKRYHVATEVLRNLPRIFGANFPQVLLSSTLQEHWLEMRAPCQTAGRSTSEVVVRSRKTTTTNFFLGEFSFPFCCLPESSVSSLQFTPWALLI